MALNITVAGDTYLGTDLVDCYFQVHYYPHNFSTAVFSTEDTAYNFNIGGADHLGKDGEFKQGQVCLVNCWLGTPDKSEVTHQAIYRIIYDGEGYLYNTDIQLQPLVDTMIDVSAIGKFYINDVIQPAVSINSLYQFIYNSETLYQRPDWYGFSLNPLTSSNAMSINFNYGNGLTSDGSISYSTVGSKLIELTVIDGLNRTYTDNVGVFIHYSAPIVTLDYSPKAPDIDDEITLITDIQTDTDIQCRLYLDDNFLLSYVEAQKSFNVGKLLLDSHSAFVEVIYNDGENDKSLRVDTNLVMRNMPPEISIVVVEDRPPILKLEALINNRDDDIKSVEWVISQIVEDNSTGLVTKVRIDVIQGTSLDYVFSNYGDIEIVLKVTDIHLATSTATHLVSIDCEAIGIVYVQDVEFIQTGVITQDFTQKMIKNSYRFTPDIAVEDFTQKILKTEVFDEIVQDKAFTMYKVEEI